MSPGGSCPRRPPFALRARLLTPLAAGGTRHEPDGLLLVDAAGRLTFAGAAADRPAGRLAAAIDLRPWVLMPGMVDSTPTCRSSRTRARGFALDLLTWLDRLTFPTERSWSDPAVAERLAPAIFEAFAAAGTTTVLAYGVVYEAAMDAAFGAAEPHGIRAILGKVMMDRVTYDPTIEPATILERSLRESADLIARWHGRDDGRLALRRHAAVRDLVHGRDAARVGGPRRARPARTGRPTSPRTRSRSPRSAASSPTPATTSTSTTGPAAWAADDPGPRDPPLGARARPPGRDRDRTSPTARPRTCSSGPA